MSRIISYRDDDGRLTAVIEDVALDNDETLMIDAGLGVDVDVKVHNPYEITLKQRRKIFALCNDIEAHTGQPRDYMRHMFQDYVKFIYGYEDEISLSDCSKQTASQIIEITLEWVFLHDILLNYKTSDLLKEDQSFLYAATMHRQCVICGKPHAELAHRYAVGSGRNRRTIDHTDNEVLALCHNHHREQHQIGIDSFNEKYYLQNSWIKVTTELNKKLQGK